MKSTFKKGILVPGALCAVIVSPSAWSQEGPVMQYQPAPGYGQEAYPGYAYGQGGYAYDPSAYAQDPYYTQDPYAYGQPAYGYQQPAYPDYGYAEGYAQQGYPYYGYQQQPAYGYAPMAPYPGYGRSSSGFAPFSSAQWNKWEPDVFGEKSPFQDPLQNQGYWANSKFRPWRSGPFAYDKWEDHPGTQMPWGNFPGWGKGFFGGYGPDSWEGATPWGNDVPFKWVDPTDPEESFAQIWEDALNAPSKIGRLPPGWTAPYISVPNPIDVENEFERNAMNAPDEIHKMWGDGGGSFGGEPDKKESDSDEGKKKEGAPQSN